MPWSKPLWVDMGCLGKKDKYGIWHKCKCTFFYTCILQATGLSEHLEAAVSRTTTGCHRPVAAQLLLNIIMA